MGKTYLIPCKIESGGFISERTFSIPIDEGKLVGVASVKYLRDREKQNLDEHTPRHDEVIDGFVECRIIRENGEDNLVEVPSSELIHVPDSELVEM